MGRNGVKATANKRSTVCGFSDCRCHKITKPIAVKSEKKFYLLIKVRVR